MLNTIVVTSSEHRRFTLHRVVVESGVLHLHTSLGAYPSPAERRRLFQLAQPEVVLVDLETPDACIEFANECRLHWPRAAILGMDPPRGFSVEGIGLAGYFSFPPTVKTLTDAVNRAVHRVDGAMLESVHAFLPSKAGIGCTTLVFNTAHALAAAGKKVLVVECDLRSGTMSLMLDLSPEGSIQAALRNVARFELERLPTCVAHAHGVDLLLSSRQPMESLPDWSQYLQLLTWARGRWDFILVDFPELINQATVELALRARSVFLVTTQELLPLKLAEQRFADLEQWGVPHDRVQIILNRFHKNDIAVGDIEKYLRAPVRANVPNDYQAVRKAIMEGKPVSPSSSAGRAYAALAEQLIAGEVNTSKKSVVSKFFKALHIAS